MTQGGSSTQGYFLKPVPQYSVLGLDPGGISGTTPDKNLLGLRKVIKVHANQL